MQLFNGEIGKMYGVRFVEHNNAWRSGATQGTYSGAGVVFSAFMFGRNAFGVPDLATVGSPFAPQVNVVQGADKSDPANLIKALVSFKTYYVAKVSQPKWIAHFYTQSGSNA
jgi:N4-gp56 family major capsid protein